MVYIVGENYGSLKPYIERYRLKKATAFKHFNMFESGSFYALEAGEDALKAAIGLTKLCENHKPKENDILLCISKSKRKLVRIANKITSAITGESFYPDMLYSSEFDEGELLSKGFEISVFSSGSYYFSKANMIFPEYGDGGEEIICDWIDKLESFLEKKEQREAVELNESVDIHAIAKKFYLTEYMKVELKQTIKYAKLTGININRVLNEFAKLEVSNKNEGKQCFYELRTKLSKQGI